MSEGWDDHAHAPSLLKLKKKFKKLFFDESTKKKCHAQKSATPKNKSFFFFKKLSFDYSTKKSADEPYNMCQP